MPTPPASHLHDRASELLPPLAAHRVLTILAGDAAPAPDGDAADGVARFIIRQGWGRLTPETPEAAAVREPASWFVRVTFPGIPPPDPFIVAVATAAGFRVESLAQGPPFAPEAVRGGATGGRPPGPDSCSGAKGDVLARWLLVAPQPADVISSAVARLRETHRIHAVPFRRRRGARRGHR